MSQPEGGGKATRSKNESQVMKDKLAQQQACKRQLKEKFKSVDYFGQSVSLTWNGEDQYKTVLGASVSWIIFIVIIAYSAYRLVYMVERRNPSVARLSTIRPPEEDLPFKPQDMGFDFAFGLDQPLDKSIGYFTVRYIK